VINGTAATIIAKGPKKSDFLIHTIIGPGLIIEIIDQTQYASYRVGIRSLTNDWDSVYTITGNIDTIYPVQATNYYVSVASVDDVGMESLFSKEINIFDSQMAVNELQTEDSRPFHLLQNKPNPFDEATIIGVYVKNPTNHKKAWITIEDVDGKEIERIVIDLTNEINEVQYTHGYGKSGSFTYTLYVDNKKIESKRMVFAN